LAIPNGDGFFSELFKNCDNEQIYHFEKKSRGLHAKKMYYLVSTILIFFLPFLFYYKYFIIILFSFLFCKKVVPSVSRDQLCRNWADKNNINAQRKDPHTVKDSPLTIFLTSNTFFSKMALQ